MLSETSESSLFPYPPPTPSLPSPALGQRACEVSSGDPANARAEGADELYLDAPQRELG